MEWDIIQQIIFDLTLEEFQPVICMISNTSNTVNGNQKLLMCPTRIVKGEWCTCLTVRVLENPSRYIHWQNMWGAVRLYRQRHMTPLVSVRHIRTLSVHVSSCPTLCIASLVAMPEWDDELSRVSFARVTHINVHNMWVYLHFHHTRPWKRRLWFLRTQLNSG